MTPTPKRRLLPATGLGLAWAAAFSAVMLTAAWLRFGLGGAGLPFRYDPDEADFVYYAYRMLADRDPNPHWFGHPGGVTIYLLAALYGVYAVASVTVGWFADLQDVGRQYWFDPSAFYLLGRCSIALFGVGSVALLFSVTRLLAGRWVGLLAAAILALAPLHIEYSALIRTDIQQSFFLLAASWFSLRLAQGGGRRDALLAGAMLGLAIATKYPSVLAGIMLVAGSLAAARQRREPWWTAASPLVWSTMATLLACFAASPFLFLDFSQALSDVLGEARPVHLSATSLGFASSLWFYLTQIGGMLGAAGAGLAMVGAVWLAYVRPAAGAVLVGFFAAYLTFIASLPLVWARWVIPLLPFACLAAALGVGVLWRAAQRWLPSPWGGAMVLGAVFAHIGTDALRAERTRAAILAPAPATEAREWALRNLPKGSRVLAERYTPQFDNGYFALYEVKPDGRTVFVEASVAKYLVPSGIIGELRDSGDLAVLKIDYIILGNDFDRRAAEPQRYGTMIARYQDIFARWTLVYEANPASSLSRGGVVRILRAPVSIAPTH